MIQVKDLVKTFHTGEREVTILNKLNFNIPSGQFVSITGRSGSGKSTLLYQLSLLDHASGGEVLVDGVDITKLKGSERIDYRLYKLGYIFQDYAVLPTLTAMENVLLPLLEQGFDFAEAEKLAEESLMNVGLGERLHNLPNQLSGGQQQRVSIARAVVHKPTILFADEPTANLDTASSKAVLKVFLDLHKKGQTIVMVTHELDYARLAERIIELRDGNIISDQLLKKKRGKFAELE